MLEETKLGYLVVGELSFLSSLRPPSKPRIAWDTTEHAEAFIGSPLHADFDTALQRAFDTARAAYSYHVTFAIAPQPALDAQLTEFAVWRLKADTDVAAYQRAITQLHAYLAARVAPSEAAGAIGCASEDSRVGVACLGWDSIRVSGLV